MSWILEIEEIPYPLFVLIIIASVKGGFAGSFDSHLTILNITVSIKR